MPINAQQVAATEMLAALLAHVAAKYPDDQGVGVGDIADLPTGVAAGILLPTGDRFRLMVEWVGDDEADAPVESWGLGT